ncbi:MAG TPA: HAD family hydrolase, partial [Phycisphaerae bacterium]|nr:HAD family hydrolase [Phycisphaerae bacterium]
PAKLLDFGDAHVFGIGSKKICEKKMKYEAVVFDLDGTLLNTLEDLADCMNATIGEFGYAPQPLENYRYYVGDGVVNLARRACCDSDISEETIKKIVARNREIYGNGWAVKTRPYSGIPELLDELAARGVKMSVMSNKPHQFTRLCVERFFDIDKFVVVQGVMDGIAPKPDPAGVDMIVKTIGLPREKFLYLGDTNTDMKTAVAAKMFAVGATWGFRTAEELLKYGAMKLVDRPEELLKLL